MKVSLALVIASLLVAGLAFACRQGPAALPAPLVEVPLPADAAERWRKAGYSRLEPPIPLPGDEGGRLEAEIWARLPDGARIDVVDGTWVWPVGATLDRVEWLSASDGRRIADVRGTEITPRGERFHMLRPSSPSADSLARGDFARGDARAQDEVRRAFGALASLGGGFARGDRGADRAHRADASARLSRLLDCAGCHEHSVPEAEGDARWLRRSTDASGFYVPAYVMRDDAPMERYRPIDRASEHRFVTVRCGDAVVESRGRTDVRCPDGRVPHLHLDLPSALRAGDEHARSVCASRVWLAGHMAPRARAYFADALLECGEAP
jgi:hypothetical protein